MAVFTPVSASDAGALLRGYDIGELTALEAIAEGVENTNYRLETTGGRFVLTLFEGRTDEASLPFCLGLTDHLALRGFPAPRPVEDRAGGWLSRVNGRPAAIIEWKGEHRARQRVEVVARRLEYQADDRLAAVVQDQHLVTEPG